MPTERLRRIGKRVAIGVGAVAVGAATWLGIKEHKPVVKAPPEITKPAIDSKRPFSLDRIFIRQSKLYSKDKHNKATTFHKAIVAKMFGAGKPYYKRQVTSVRELDEILGKMYFVLNKEISPISSAEPGIFDFFEAYSRKKRDCDIGTILFLETLRMMNLKNVDFLYGHRHGHAFLYVKLDGQNYRYETMQGKFMPLLDEDVAIETEDLENLFRFSAEYTPLSKLNPVAAKEKLTELMQQSHIFEVDFDYASRTFADNLVFARTLLEKAYNASKYSPRVGLGWATLELTQGNVDLGLKVLEGVKIPKILSHKLAEAVALQLQALRVVAYVRLLKEPKMKTVISLVSDLKEKLDSAQKVY